MLTSPFPYFGGKSRVAREIWRRIGDVGNYIEPFCGSAAVLLLRPQFHTMRMETINDADAYVANFWRATSRDPDAVAQHCNWPVNEVDLEARHKWLVTAARKREHAVRMRDDPDYYDARIAGWWCSTITGASSSATVVKRQTGLRVVSPKESLASTCQK